MTRKWLIRCVAMVLFVATIGGACFGLWAFGILSEGRERTTLDTAVVLAALLLLGFSAWLFRRTLSSPRAISIPGFAKWTAIIWSLLCLLGIFIGLIKVFVAEGVSTDAAAVGASLGLGLWAGIWLAITGPALVIYLVSAKRSVAPLEVAKAAHLCNECGKYHEGEGKFCPNCGKPT